MLCHPLSLSYRSINWWIDYFEEVFCCLFQTQTNILWLEAKLSIICSIIALIAMIWSMNRSLIVTSIQLIWSHGSYSGVCCLYRLWCCWFACWTSFARELNKLSRICFQTFIYFGPKFAEAVNQHKASAGDQCCSQCMTVFINHW